MKLSNVSLLLFLSIVFFLSSCSIEQRVHRTGFHIEWNSKNKSTIAKHEKDKHSSKRDGFANSELQLFEVEENLVNLEIDVVTASIEKRPDLVSSNSIFTPVTIELESSTKLSNAEPTQFKRKEVKQYLKEYKSIHAVPLSTSQNCKDWLVTLLLVIFVGGLGIHRFYLGYTTIGIIQLLTLGGCGVWALIDLIRIVMRDLEPKDASYCD